MASENIYMHEIRTIRPHQPSERQCRRQNQSPRCRLSWRQWQYWWHSKLRRHSIWLLTRLHNNNQSEGGPDTTQTLQQINNRQWQLLQGWMICVLCNKRTKNSSLKNLVIHTCIIHTHTYTY